MYSDNNLRMDVDEASNFAKNEVRVRAEIRAALAVLRTPVLREIVFIIGS
jgi:hypothetical protein